MKSEARRVGAERTEWTAPGLNSVISAQRYITEMGPPLQQLHNKHLAQQKFNDFSFKLNIWIMFNTVS